MTDPQRSLRRPLLGAALSAAAFGLCGLSPSLLAAGKRRVSVREEEIEPGRYRDNPQTRAFIDEMATRHGFEPFSPYTVPPVIATAAAIPFDALTEGSVERLYALKAEVVAAGVRAVTGIDMPVNAKRRFQDGAGGDANRRWKLDKAWCRRTFLRQWEERLEVAWGEERVSGNDVSIPFPRQR